jgi:hypothetical protein
MRELYDLLKMGPTSANTCPARIKSNFICAIGYGSGEAMYPRNPRLSFEAASREV